MNTSYEPNIHTAELNKFKHGLLFDRKFKNVFLND